LLEVVPLGDEVIIVARPTGLFGAVRDFALQGERVSVEPPQEDFLMRRTLRENRNWEKHKEKETADKKSKRSFQNHSPLS
jgi:hypothetical protein